MSKEYDGTPYDLGLIYRMLDRLDDASKCFSSITSIHCRNPSEYPMYVINAYEQQAFCKLDLLARETDPEKRINYDIMQRNVHGKPLLLYPEWSGQYLC